MNEYSFIYYNKTGKGESQEGKWGKIWENSKVKNQSLKPQRKT
jgi:hypothetical protein